MEMLRNFPCFSLILSMGSAILSSGLKGKTARVLNTCILSVITFFSAGTLYLTLSTGTSYVYKMGRFPAPWGNEIRFGVLEALMALFFCVIMILSLKGGQAHIDAEIDESKINLYYILINLLLSSLLALIYTNDLFTAYVFVEINTISACGLIMIKNNGHTIEAATRYMIMSLLGSGLLLMGICVLYDITGHLLMSNIKERIAVIYAEGNYTVPLIISIGIISAGLAIKSALYPFHTWLPNAYGYSNVSSAAILSSLVSKGYIFLLIKIFYRVVGFDIIVNSRIINILFIFGLAGMIMGSINAIWESDIRRMIAFSSVAQIGYIYMGFGLGIQAGVVASIFHIFSHAIAKSMLFISAVGITDSSGESTDFFKLTGAGYRNVIAGITFTVGSLSMVGIPLFSGFISKILFAQACVSCDIGKMLPTLICLAVSTILNAIYFLKTVIRIYTPEKTDYKKIYFKDNITYGIVCIFFIMLCVVFGLWSEPIVNMVEQGLGMFS